MLLQDCLSYERILLATPNTGQSRWSDVDLTVLTDRAVKYLVAEIMFPESRLNYLATGTQQEYQLPPMHAIYRVYVNGQSIARIPGGVDTLEGIQVQINDSTAQGAPAAGSGAPPSPGGAMQTQWSVQTPVTYPYINSWGAPVPSAIPYSPGQSPRWYTRGGFLGIVPAVGLAGAYITVDGVRIPDTLATSGTGFLGQTIIVPDNFMEGIADFVNWRAACADDSATSQSKRQTAFGELANDIKLLRTWARSYRVDDDQILPQTYRSAFRFAGHRVGNGYGSW